MTAGITAREVALRVLWRVEVDRAFADVQLDAELGRSRLAQRDRRLASELVYGTLRWRLFLDWVLEQVAGRQMGALPAWIRNILRLGAYQLLFLERIPPWAACNVSVELAKKYGHRGTAALVNAVLRRLARQRHSPPQPPAGGDPDSLAIRYSHPAWAVREWQRWLGEETTLALLEANNRQAPAVVRANLLRCTREELRRRLEEEGVRAEALAGAPEAMVLASGTAPVYTRAWREGLFTPQDLSSMVAARALEPQPGQLLIDACAAPGGKATHLAELAGDRARVLAVDVHPQRLQLVGENARRLSLTSLELVCQDARRLPENWRGQADGVLVDAPCSGLGLFRRHPDARWRKEPGLVTALADLQLEILCAAAECLRPGGLLLYSVCTLTRAETEGVTQRLESLRPDLVPASLKGLGTELLDGCPGAERGKVLLLPHLHGTDGFFLARYRRKEGFHGFQHPRSGPR